MSPHEEGRALRVLPERGRGWSSPSASGKNDKGVRPNVTPKPSQRVRFSGTGWTHQSSEMPPN